MNKLKTKNSLRLFVGSLFVLTALTSCGSTTTGPTGPQGEQGIPGVAGKDGKDGKDGQDGKTPYIGENGDWFVDGVDTGVFAGTTKDPLEALNETTAPITHNVTGYLYNNGKFVPDYDNINETYKHSRELNIQAAQEGFVLMKNDNKALPLRTGKNVTMFGFRSYNPMNGGGGSGSGVVGAYGVPYTDFVRGMEMGGFEVNPGVKDAYIKAGAKTASTELATSILTDAEASYERYHDAAIITIGRSGSEGSDIKRAKIPGHSDTTEHFLELDDNEEALIKYVKQHFDKVIVLINSANTMELGELEAQKTADNLGVDAIMQIGHLGNDGAAALGKVLGGEVSPSGRTVDTWTKDFTKDPSYKNFSDMTQNGEGFNNNLYNDDGTVNKSYHEVEYREDIYLGYKYYETLYTEKSKTSTQDADSWYKEAVVYPFGYGLSYTTFNWELVGAGNSDITAGNQSVTMKVKVTNTGDVAGKDVVEMYVNPPYTYGGIEKASANLMDFAKTKTLQPGESEILTLQCYAQDFASFDWNDANGNDFKGYELEKGSYQISLNRSAHEKILSVDRNVPADLKLTTDYTTGNNIEAVFSQSEGTWKDFNSTSESLTSNLLSRTDLTAIPDAASIEDRTMTTSFEAEVTALDNMAGSKDRTTDPWYVSEIPSGWKQGEGVLDENGHYATLLRDMSGVSYQEYKVSNGKVTVGTDPNSQKWESFMNQLSWEEMTKLVQYGWYGRLGLDSIGMTFQGDTDGPAQAGGPYFWVADRAPGLLGGGTCWIGGVLEASTWNEDLMNEIGKAIGNECLFNNQNGWYGPGMNIHRSPFSGRNFEYYSEDGVLSGKIGASIVEGASSKGVVTYIKHMFLNDQETDRDTLFTFATEQAIREIYLKPFEMCIKAGHSAGIMGSKNRIGKVSSEANAALTDEIVRGEWNFKGVVVTDAYSGMPSKTVDAMLRAGTDIPLSGVGKRNNPDGTYFLEQNRYDKETNMVYVGAKRYAPAYNGVEQQSDDVLNVASPTLYYAVRRACMHLLYTASNTSGVRNGIMNGDTYKVTLAGSRWNPSVSANLLSDHTLSAVKITSGTLPEGFKVSEDGVISGTVTDAVKGTYTITVECVVDGWIGLTDELNQTNVGHTSVGATREVTTLNFEITIK